MFGFLFLYGFLFIDVPLGGDGWSLVSFTLREAHKIESVCSTDCVTVLNCNSLLSILQQVLVCIVD